MQVNAYLVNFLILNMQNETELITECRNKVLSNETLTEEMATQ